MTIAEIHDELQGALGDAKDNFRDVRCDIFTDEEVREEADVIATLTHVLEIWDDVAPYLTPDEEVSP